MLLQTLGAGEQMRALVDVAGSRDVIHQPGSGVVGPARPEEVDLPRRAEACAVPPPREEPEQAMPLALDGEPAWAQLTQQECRGLDLPSRPEMFLIGVGCGIGPRAFDHN